MKKNIKLGSQYLLDDKIVVKVIKPLNRSNTSFMVETPNGSILTIEAERLGPPREIIR